MDNIENENEFPYYVMMSEPIPDMSVEDIRNWFAENNDEQGLATAYAVVHNKAWWVEDDVYDYEEGTEEYKKACQITDEWFALMDELVEKIFDILRSEGVDIPETGQIKVLAPFMERYGYFDGNGWWIKKDEE